MFDTLIALLLALLTPCQTEDDGGPCHWVDDCQTMIFLPAGTPDNDDDIRFFLGE